MPTDANGTYSLPPGYEATTGETIEASQHNPPLEDIETALTQRMMASGVKPMSGPLLLADGTVANPALAFNSAQGTGWYKTTNGWGFAIGGALVFELTANGAAKGARFLGELIPITRTVVPALCVMPYGQQLSRTTYADLWALAQTEISLGNAFYNSGNGTTTFGIGDLRGRVVAFLDTMGGVGANRLNGVLVSNQIGAAGGVQSQVLTENQMPAHLHSGNTGAGAPNDHDHTQVAPTSRISAVQAGDSIPLTGIWTGTTTEQTTVQNQNMGHIHPFTTSIAGSGAAVPNVQPTMMANCALFAGA